MGTFGSLLFFYVIWLSFGPRQIIIAQIRERKIVPIVLLAALYLLDALIATANGAAVDAELLMSGEADSSIEVVFTMTEGVRDTLPSSGLILVTARNGNYYVVERQATPTQPETGRLRRPLRCGRQRADAAGERCRSSARRDFVDEIMDELATPTAP